MIWGRKFAEKYHEDWRPWFAWYPVELKGGRWAWLETVERRGVWGGLGGGVWVYRAAGEQ